MYSAKAPGKVILFGEHAVVYGITGIAAAVDLHDACTLHDNNEIGAIIHGKYVKINLDKSISLSKDVDELIEKKEYTKLEKLKSKFEPYLYCRMYVLGLLSKYADIKNMNIEASSELRKGMGSSTAFFAALIKAISDMHGLKFTKDEINELVFKADCAQSFTPSGIDNNTVVYGGYVKFNKEDGPEPLKIEKELPIVIGDTGKRVTTMEMVSKVRDLINNDMLRKEMDSIESISRDALCSIKNYDLVKLGELMNTNQSILRKLQTSSSELENLINASLGAGAYGAKLSGAGGGGIMIALTDEQEKVADAIIKSGGEAIITKLGVEGIK